MIDLNSEHPDYTYQGIGVRFKGHPVEQVTDAILTCDDEDCDHTDDECYYVSWDIVIDDTKYIVTWVGDDQEHIVEESDLVEVPEGHEICSCGQVNCWAYGIDAE